MTASPDLSRWKAQAEECAELLRQGKVLVLPTETYYGIVADAISPQDVRRVTSLKGREAGKPIPLIAGDVEGVELVAILRGALAKALAERFWPGPLTLVVPARSNLPEEVTGGSKTVGIRIPGPSLALAVALAYGSPLTATSANRAGGIPATTVGELDSAVSEGVDLVVDGGPTPGGEASTVLDLTGNSPRFLRRGTLTAEVESFVRAFKG